MINARRLGTRQSVINSHSNSSDRLLSPPLPELYCSLSLLVGSKEQMSSLCLFSWVGAKRGGDVLETRRVLLTY